MDVMTSEEQTKLLFEVIELDRKHVMLYVSLCFAIPAFSIAQLKIADMHLVTRCILSLSLLSFIISGMSFFYYAQVIHWRRLAAVRAALEKGPNEIRDILMGPERGVWALAKKYFERGGWWLRAAVLLYVIFFLLYLFSKEIFS